jgi:uroporphyrinogen-III synthase
VSSLHGKTIALTEARRAAELARLVAKLGGVPYAAPAVREIPRRDLAPARAALDRICGGEIGVILFLTGVGTRAFLDLADAAGRQPALLAALGRMFVGARGPKPVAVLREAGVRIDLTPREPTSEGLIAELGRVRDLRGAVVAVQLYGEGNPLLGEGLADRGASMLEIPLYEWALPADAAPLARLVHDLIDGRIDVLAVTSSPQVRNVVAVAEGLGLRDRLLGALRRSVTVAAQGPVCATTLRDLGVKPQIQPAKGTMGALVHAIAEHLTRDEQVRGGV